jgi:hypothetical protein
MMRADSAAAAAPAPLGRPAGGGGSGPRSGSAQGGRSPLWGSDPPHPPEIPDRTFSMIQLIENAPAAGPLRHQAYTAIGGSGRASGRQSRSRRRTRLVLAPGPTGTPWPPQIQSAPSARRRPRAPRRRAGSQRAR